MIGLETRQQELINRVIIRYIMQALEPAIDANILDE